MSPQPPHFFQFNKSQIYLDNNQAGLLFSIPLQRKLQIFLQIANQHREDCFHRQVAVCLESSSYFQA
jgi:biotin synthase-like enzyme